jgi:hypothetical protein
MPMDKPQGFKKAKRFLNKQATKNSVQKNRKGLGKGTTASGGKGKKQADSFHSKGYGE